MKKCTKCGIEKDDKEFRRCNGYKNNIRSICKHCDSEYQKTYKWRGGISRSEYNKTYYERNKKILIEKSMRNASCNKERVKKASKKYLRSEKGKEAHSKHASRYYLKKTIGMQPPEEVVEIRSLINKTKRLCKTLTNLEKN